MRAESALRALLGCKIVTVQVALTHYGIDYLISKYPGECFEDVASLFA